MPKKTKLSNFRKQARNANKHTERGLDLLDKSIRKNGWIGAMTAASDGEIFDGSARLETVAEALPADPIVVETDGKRPVIIKRTDIKKATDPKAVRLALEANRIAQVDLNWDVDVLAEIAAKKKELVEDLFGDNELKKLGVELGEPEPAPEAQMDKADELLKKWKVKTGDLWQIGEHRIVCGDCTDAVVVKRVMGKEKAALLHADPPYGMGKEKDGIENDNLYREKLDAFQMAWWKACRLYIADNASVYIWGNAEDLWRLWYSGGLKNSERLTLRNEIVWDKGSGQGQTTDGIRSYPPASERCIFFMLGEQGFNNNSDNYWDGWEPVRSYLAEQVKKMEWTPKDIQKITGVGMYAHWFTKSQFVFITKDNYQKLQRAAKDYDAFKKDYDAFKKDYDELKKDYDELKKDFYFTRAYFDNTHENMNDVWKYDRVAGEDRQGHATPKPIEMMERIIKSSSAKDDIVLIPFGGTFPEIVACERLGRKGRGIEITPKYVAVALQRLADMGLKPKLLK